MFRRVAPALLVLVIASTLWSQTQQPELRTGFWRGMKVTYAWVPEKNGGGKPVYQGDVLLDHVDASPNGPQSLSVGVAYNTYLWTKVGGVAQIPYTIDPASGNLTNLNNAITAFNNAFSGIIQLVAYTGQTNYVDFNFDFIFRNGSHTEIKNDTPNQNNRLHRSRKRRVPSRS